MAVRYINDDVSVIPFPALKERGPQVVGGPGVPDGGASGAGLLQRWMARTALRRDLRRLLKASPHLVRDIGLDETLVRREVTLPFWQDGPLPPGTIRLPAV